MQPQLEMALNGLAADLEIARNAIRILMLDAFQNTPQPLAVAGRFREALTQSIAEAPPPGVDPQLVERRHQFLLQRVEDFCAPLERLLGGSATNPMPQSY
jgi:hypothetical protein